MSSSTWSRPRIMGIVNINDDSFSGDGTLDISAALDQASQMVEDGADIIDIGAESARTNREAILIEEEVNRLIPFIEQWGRRVSGLKPRHKDQLFPPLLSVNSWRTEVIEAVLKTGKIDLVNDIGGLPDAANADLCAKYGGILLIMHTVGLPKVPHFEQHYDDVWSAMESFFEEKIGLARGAGLSNDQIMIDPGIDFAKQKGDNLHIYRKIEALHKFGLPILLPISRKTVIGEVLGIQEPIKRDGGTVACLARGIQAGVQIFRVHNVKAASDTAQTLFAINSQG